MRNPWNPVSKNQREVFPTFWKKFDDYVERDRLVSVREARREMENGNDRLSDCKGQNIGPGFDNGGRIFQRWEDEGKRPHLRMGLPQFRDWLCEPGWLYETGGMVVLNRLPYCTVDWRLDVLIPLW